MPTPIGMTLKNINNDPSQRVASGAGDSPKAGGNAAFRFEAPLGTADGNEIIFLTDGTLNFGTKKTPAVSIWEDFKSVPDGGLLKNTKPQWTRYANGGNNGAKVTTVSARYPGAKSAINDFSDHGFATNFHLIPETDTLYVSYWHRFTGGLGEGDYGVGKLMRATTNQSNHNEHYNGRGTHSISNFNPTPPSGNGGYLAYTNSNDQEVNLGYLTYDFTRWNFIEYEFRLNTPGQADGVLRLWINGVLINNVTNATQRLLGNSMMFDSVLLGIDGANRTGDWSMLQSDTYVDISGPAKFVIGNAPTLAASTIREPQPPINWESASRAVCTINRGALPGNAWAFFENDARASSSGIYLGRA